MCKASATVRGKDRARERKKYGLLQTTNCAGEVAYRVKVPMKFGKHAEELWMYATSLGKVPMILGHTWLQKHNPDINWLTGKIVLN